MKNSVNPSGLSSGDLSLNVAALTAASGARPVNVSPTALRANTLKTTRDELIASTRTVEEILARGGPRRV